MQTKADNESIYDSNDIFELALLTTIGDREEQQDNIGYLLGNTDGIVVLCDGMGGYTDGKKASNTGVESILQGYEKLTCSNDVIEMMQNITVDAGNKVAALESEGITGTTEVFLYIRHNELYWNSVGDSRAYVVRKGRYHQFTQDQNVKTVLDEKLATGVISQDEYNSQIVKGEALISYLGMTPLNLIDYNIKPFGLNQDDMIVVMSDGVYKYLDESIIFQIFENFTNVSDAVNALENRIKRESISKNKKRDNMTVAVIRVR